MQLGLKAYDNVVAQRYDPISTPWASICLRTLFIRFRRLMFRSASSIKKTLCMACWISNDPLAPICRLCRAAYKEFQISDAGALRNGQLCSIEARRACQISRYFQRDASLSDSNRIRTRTSDRSNSLIQCKLRNIVGSSSLGWLTVVDDVQRKTGLE